MSFAATLVQVSFPMLSIATILRGALMLSLLASLLMFFRPLLSGIVRALVLAVYPRSYRARGNKALPGA
jgi:hypothetical protein